MINKRFFHTEVVKASRKSASRRFEFEKPFVLKKQQFPQKPYPMYKLNSSKTRPNLKAKTHVRKSTEIKNPFNVTIGRSKILE